MRSQTLNYLLFIINCYLIMFPGCIATIIASVASHSSTAVVAG